MRITVAFCIAGLAAGCSTTGGVDCSPDTVYESGRNTALQKARGGPPPCASVETDTRWNEGFGAGVAEACVARQAWQSDVADDFCLEFAGQEYSEAADLRAEAGKLKDRLLEIEAALQNASDEAAIRKLRLEEVNVRQELTTLEGLATVRGWATPRGSETKDEG